MIKGICLTKRDYFVLEDLYLKTLMSFSDLSKVHFTGCAKQTVSNRLNRLVKALLIEKHRIGGTVFCGQIQTVGMVYTMTKRGIRQLQEAFPQKIFRDSAVILNTSTLTHDLKLNKLIDDLRIEFCSLEFQNGKHLIADSGGFTKRIPDLRLIDKKSGGATSIELELTLKSEKRLREIITSYKFDPKTTTVIYISPSETILRSIAKVITGGAPLAGSFTNDGVRVGKFQLRLLDFMDRVARDKNKEDQIVKIEERRSA